MNDTIRWGILGTASIARRRLIPALHTSLRNVAVAVASRDPAQAAAFAAETGIARSFGSYQALLDDREIDAVYIPLPNHLHLEWSVKALEAGKHVLCEKPIGLAADEARTLRSAAAGRPGQVVMEAFMYRTHPRWRAARQLVKDGAIGELGTVHTFFSYDNRDANNIRNIAVMGGGAWLDIGCYGVSVARYLFDDEPTAVSGAMQIDPAFSTDRLTSAVLRFARGTATVTCATQLAWHQSVSMHGSSGRIEVPLPFNPPGDVPTRLLLHRGETVEEQLFDSCDQFREEVDQFAAAVIDGAPPPVSLDDSVANMVALDGLTDQK
jgi:predicted dehydrogenase